MLSAGAFAPFRLVNARRGLVLMYHRFGARNVPGAVPSREFAEHLQYLTKHYTVVSIPTMVAHLATGKPLARPMAAITIDDGHRDAYEVAFPILKRFGVPATLFVVTGFLDRLCWLWTDQVRHMFDGNNARKSRFSLGSEFLELFGGRIDEAGTRFTAADFIADRLKQMPEAVKNRALQALADALDVKVPASPPPEYASVTWEHARELDRNGVAVESHTVTHPILTNVSTDQLAYELTESKARLETELDRRATVFCYPNGNWTPSVCQAVKRAGYAYAVTTTTGFNEPGVDPFALKRLGAEADLARFAKITSGFELWQMRVRWQMEARPS
jgi:peptidoglycan/xylan/chitin deacetylase (PgdA/CDA1 family)